MQSNFRTICYPLLKLPESSVNILKVLLKKHAELHLFNDGACQGDGIILTLNP